MLVTGMLFFACSVVADASDVCVLPKPNDGAVVVAVV